MENDSSLKMPSKTCHPPVRKELQVYNLGKISLGSCIMLARPISSRGTHRPLRSGSGRKGHELLAGANRPDKAGATSEATQIVRPHKTTRKQFRNSRQTSPFGANKR